MTIIKCSKQWLKLTNINSITAGLELECKETQRNVLPGKTVSISLFSSSNQTFETFKEIFLVDILPSKLLEIRKTIAKFRELHFDPASQPFAQSPK